MKHYLTILFSVVLFQLVEAQQKVLTPATFEILGYTPPVTNQFKINAEVNLSGQFVYNAPTIPLTFAAGMQLGMVTAGDMPLGIGIFYSRAPVHFQFHGALGLLYRSANRSRVLLVGPAVSRFQYILSGVPEGPENEKYQEFSRIVTDQASWIRGSYYIASYLFAEGRWHTGLLRTLEVNILIPTDFFEGEAGIQPGGSLVKAIRVKGELEKKRFSLKVDMQIPSVEFDYDLRFDQITGRAELRYNVASDATRILVGVGYRRGEHALNFVHLTNGRSGLYASPYVLLRFEKH